MKILSGVKLKTKSPTPIGRVRQDCVKEVWGPEEKLHNPSAAVLVPPLRSQRGRARGGRLAWYRPDRPTAQWALRKEHTKENFKLGCKFFSLPFIA